MKILLYDLGSNRVELNEPIGIEIIAGAIKKEISDAQIDFLWDLIEPSSVDNLKTEYDIIGFSAKLGTWERLKYYLDLLKDDIFWGRIIVGGPLATYGFNEILKIYKNVICVRGEGETSFVNICNKINNVKDIKDFNLNDIQNLAFWKENAVIETNRGFENIDLLPKPYRFYLNEVIKKKGIVRIEGSRGCSWSRCDFCNVSEHHGCSIWRPLPINYIIEELILLSDLGCISPYFTDEDFFGNNYERSYKLAKSIIQAKEEHRINYKMNFFFSARINDILQVGGMELIKIWKEAGLRELFIGLESGVQRQLQRYGKAATPLRNSRTINLLKELDLQLDIGYILFDPEMTFDELIENLNYIESESLSNYDARSLKNIRAQPFSSLTDRYKEKKIINGELNLDLLSYPLEYEDERVHLVMINFSKWEESLINKVYLIQSYSRGEVSSEVYRKYLKEQLSLIRECDFKAIKFIVNYFLEKTSHSDYVNNLNMIANMKNEIINNVQLI